MASRLVHLTPEQAVQVLALAGDIVLWDHVYFVHDLSDISVNILTNSRPVGCISRHIG